MRSTMLFGLLMAATTPSMMARESDADGALVLTADKIELNLGTKERGVLSFDAVSDDDGDRKRLRLRLTQPNGTFVLVSDDKPKTDSTRRWLGVQVGEVPTPLGVHLGLDKSHGVMILNIIEDSPADAAGMKQYDVVVEVNGKKVKDGSGAFARSISSLDDDEAITLQVIQAGKPRELKAKLSTPPTDGKRKFKFKLSDGVELDRFHIRGGIANPGTLNVTAWTMLIGVTMLAPLAIAEIALGNTGGFSAQNSLLMLYLGSLGIAQLMFVFSLTRLSPTQVVIYVNFNPLIATALEAAFLEETLTGTFLFGALAVIAGAVLVNWPKGR